MSYTEYIPIISNFLKGIESDVIIRDGSNFYYLSRDELLNQKNQDIQIILNYLSKYGIKHLSNGIKIAFEDWNERVAPLLPPDNSNRFIKLIRDMRQNIGKMSQDSIDSFKSFFKMNSHNNLPVDGKKTVEVFWSTDPNQSWKCEVVKRFNQFKHLVERGPDVQIQAILITVSILLVIWSLCDLHKVFKDCRIIESLIEKDKTEYVNDLNCLELELKGIITALESLSNDQEEDTKRKVSLGVYKSHLPTLHSKTEGIINKIKTFDDKIQSDIGELSNREFCRKVTRIVSALLSLVSITTTVRNWNNWSAPQRTTGLVVGGATGFTAIVAHLSVNQLQQLQETLKQTLTDLKNLNELLGRIKLAEDYHKKSTDYNFLRHEFENYLQAIKDFKENFQTKDQKNGLLT